MPILHLDKNYLGFPPKEYFPKNSEDPSGIVAIGGDTKPERLLEAYKSGIFPWPHEEFTQDLLWFSPDPRFILDLKNQDFKINKSLEKFIKKNNKNKNFDNLIIKFDTDFENIILNCAYQKRPNQNSTWITDQIIKGYCELFDLGFAHSVEAYLSHPGGGNELVGGLYGISLGSAFFGESMFSKVSNASKLCFYELVQKLKVWGFDFIDCQQETDLLAGFGAKNISRDIFLDKLEQSNQKVTKKGPWT